MNKLNHIAFIMDGNGRWGLKKKNSRNYGHLKGIKAVETVIKSALIKKIPYLTLYTFSTENWGRPDNEINFLFDLIRKSLKKKIKTLNLKRLKNLKKNKILNPLKLQKLIYLKKKCFQNQKVF